MGILCKIRLHRPPGGKFTPNGIVSRVINYSIDKPLSIKTITVTMKGSGRVVITVKNRDSTTFYTAEEEYFSIQNSVLEKQGENLIPSGAYEIPFKFNLPEDIPTSLDLQHTDLGLYVTCRIKYSVCIHFATPGKLTFDKKFDQEIVVIRNNKLISPRYPTEIKVYGEVKKLFHIIKNNSINLKVRMFNSIIPPGGSVPLEYELTNNSDLQLKGMEVKLMEMYTFTTKFLEEIQYKDVPNTSIQTGSLAEKQTGKMPLSVAIPPDAISFEGSKIVCKDYALQFTVQTPRPHRNLVLNVPFQVGYKPGENAGTDSVVDYDDNDEPPSYWEAMEEYKSEDA